MELIVGLMVPLIFVILLILTLLLLQIILMFLQQAVMTVLSSYGTKEPLRKTQSLLEDLLDIIRA
jgi:hypothetical protein